MARQTSFFSRADLHFSFASTPEVSVLFPFTVEEEVIGKSIAEGKFENLLMNILIMKRVQKCSKENVGRVDWCS